MRHRPATSAPADAFAQAIESQVNDRCCIQGEHLTQGLSEMKLFHQHIRYPQ